MIYFLAYIFIGFTLMGIVSANRETDFGDFIAAMIWPLVIPVTLGNWLAKKYKI